MAKLIWIILGLIGSKVVNEILYEIFNTPGGGVNVTNAALPAIGGAITLAYCFYNAFSGKSILGIPAPESHVKCPDCRELVKKDARKCKHCGCSLVPQ